MSHFRRNLTSFTKRERRGSFIFIILLLAIMLAGKFIPDMVEEKPWFIVKDSTMINSWINDIAKQKELNLHRINPNKVTIDELYDMGIPASIASGWIKYVDAGGQFYRKTDLRKIYGMPDTLYAKIEPWIQIPQKESGTYSYQQTFSKPERKYLNIQKFDPNTFTKEMLIDAGVRPQIAANIINYREAGGYFQTKKDLLKLYVIDTAYFNHLKPHISLNVELKEIVRIDSVELNSTTVEELMQLNIQKNIARRIINYKNLLGGFFSHKQLREVYSIDSYTINKLNRSSWIDTLLIKPIDINEADEYELTQHPYITQQAAEQIRKYRDFASKIESLDELFNLGIMEQQSKKKLHYYLLF